VLFEQLQLRCDARAQERQEEYIGRYTVARMTCSVSIRERSVPRLAIKTLGRRLTSLL